MILRRIDIISYRSINGEIQLNLDPNMTVLVGANDHGKSNVLRALTFLNDASVPSLDDAYSGYAPIKDVVIPTFDYVFDLTETEIASLKKNLLDFTYPRSESWTDETEVAVKKLIKEDPNIIQKIAQVKFFVRRQPHNKTAPSYLYALNGYNQNIRTFVSYYLYKLAMRARPRVVFLDEAPSLPYSIPVADLVVSDSPVLKGLLRLGGFLGKAELLGSDDNAGRRALRRFNDKFNREFKKRYSQYKKVEWTLDLTSSGTELTLELADHAMDLSNPNNRSLGFRSWLAFLLALYGETGEESPSGCLIVIDEPDVHLHPRGQKDMLAYLEELSYTNLVVFATHSPFMVPRRFPQRVRQILRTDVGTKINENPYHDNWVSVVSDLGLAGPDMFRFADNCLVVEGVADSLLITALINVAESKKMEVPRLDGFAVRWHDGASFAPSMVRALDDGLAKVMVILDDDKEGQKAKLKVNNMKRRAKAFTLNELGYPDGSSVEDLIPASAVRDSLALLLERMSDSWDLTQQKVKEVIAASLEVSNEVPRRRVLATLLVDSKCIADIRDFPSRQYANCAATCLANEVHPMTDAEVAALKILCLTLKKSLN